MGQTRPCQQDPCCVQANAIAGVIGKLHGALSDVGCRAFHVFSAEVCCQVLKVNTCLQPSNLIFSKALLTAFDGQQLITLTYTHTTTPTHFFPHMQSFTLTHSHIALSEHPALNFFLFISFLLTFFFLISNSLYSIKINQSLLFLVFIHLEQK